MKLAELKSLFLKSLIGCLITAAGLAVVAVLAGGFTDVLGRALFTIFLVAVHSLVSFGFIVNNEKQETFDSLEFFTNATFTIIVLSFMTSVLGAWGVLTGDIIVRLYALYFVLLFAILHAEVLAKTTKKQKNIDNVVMSNYIFMAVVVLMLMPVIFLPDNSTLGSFYYRLLAASGIIDATLTLIAVILHKLYLQRHPKIADPVFNAPVMLGQVAVATPATAAQPAKKGWNIFLVLLVGYIILQMGFGLLTLVLGRVGSR